MGCQSWHMACASCYLGAFENLPNSILDTAQLSVSFPRLLLGVLHNKFISCIRRIAPSKITGTSMLHFFLVDSISLDKRGKKLKGARIGTKPEKPGRSKNMNENRSSCLQNEKKKSIEHIEIFLKKQLIHKVMPLEPLSQCLKHNEG